MNELNNEILDFIKRRWSVDANWCNGNCWWFASILIERFPSLIRYYLPIEGHFIAGDGESFYDWTGKIIPAEIPYEWDKMLELDSAWTSHIIRDCMM